MDASPDVLYSNLLQDLSAYISEDLLKIYLKRKDFPVSATPKQVAAISIARSLLKKYKHTSNDQRDSVAQLKFLECSKRAEEWELQLETSYDEVLVGELKSELYKFWHKNVTVEGCNQPFAYPIVDHPFDILEEGNVGPGSSIKGRGGDFYTKIFDSPLSCTSAYLYDMYRRYIAKFPDWKQAEDNRSARYGTMLVKGNRLSFVPKNDETSRTICVEPTLNMFFQLGFGHILERRLLQRYGINLANQQFKNRELARRGSIGEGYVTLDLESASDSISQQMLRCVLPASFYGWLEKLRSPETEVPGLGYRREGMISTMGNGFTFPLQTVLFSCVVAAAAKCRGIALRHPRGQDWGNFGVNGDDIVVPDELERDVRRLLHILGFVINGSKSFVEGPFRESCGGDFYLGCPVRGVYIKSIRSLQDRYSAINQLNLFSTRTGLFLSRTVQYLLARVKWTPVPRWESADSGIQLPLSLSGKYKIDPGMQSILYWRYVPEDRKIRIAESAVVVPYGLKPRKWNPEGLYLSFLHRSVNAMTIGVRHDTVRYRRKQGVAPNWDTPQRSHPLAGWFLDTRWETACYLNLYG